MRIVRLAIADMWSYGEDTTVLSGFGRVNVIIGKNNAGKSNILAIAQWAAKALLRDGNLDKDCCLERPEIYNTRPLQRVPVPHLSATFLVETREWPGDLIPPWMARLQSIGDHGAFDARVTISLSSDGTNMQVLEEIEWVTEESLLKLCAANRADEMDIRIHLLGLAKKLVPSKIVTLDGWRKVSDPVTGTQDYAQFMHGLRAATEDVQEKRDQWDQIQSYFRELTGLRTAELYGREEPGNLNVTVNGRALALSQFGDGISQALMLAIKASLSPGAVFLLEEPETHLHPHLERHLLRFLLKKVSGQMLLTTHSSVFLDANIADLVIRVFHNNCSHIEIVEAKRDYLLALEDLGARPSDILQANVVVWVEGPSDRIFLKHALSIFAPDLQEGLQFQIIHYGGSLRSHCTFGEGDQALVDLMALGRNVVMICDRDGNDGVGPLAREKTRLGDECRRAGGLYWVTDGREIENYLPDSVLNRAYRDLLALPSPDITLGKDEYLQKALDRVVLPKGSRRRKWLKYAAHKAQVMTRLTSYITEIEDLRCYDLLEQLQRLSEFIRANNSLNLTAEEA